MRREIRIALLLTLMSGTAGAQLVIGGGPAARGARMGAPWWESRAGISGMLRLDTPYSSLDADGTFEHGNTGFTIGQSSYQPVLRSPSLRGLRFVSSLRTEHDGVIYHPVYNQLSTSLVFSRASTGGWIGRSAEPRKSGAAVAGIWRQVGSRAVVSVSSSVDRAEVIGHSYQPTTTFDSIYTDSSGWQRYPVSGGTRKDTVLSRLRWMATEAHLSWGRGWLSLDGVASYRSHIDSLRRSRMTASGFATIALRPSVALSLGVGTMNGGADYGGPVGRFFSASVKLAPAALLRPRQPPEVVAVPTAFSIGQLSDGEYELHVRLPRARVVELAGDFNDWKPVRLSQFDAGTWQTTLRLKPGTYHMNIRVDGSTWMAPPGVPAVADEFNGQVGLVIIR